MKNLLKFSLPKIVLLIVLGTIIYSCSPVKRVPDNKLLLVKNDILVDNEKVTDENIQNLLYQKPNSRVGKIPIRLYLYHLSKRNADSSYIAWLHKKPKREEKLIQLLSKKQVDRLGESFLVSGYSNFFKRIGESPVIIDTAKISKSKIRLNSYYKSIGFLDSEVSHKLDTTGKKLGKVTYSVEKNQPYVIDSLISIIYTKSIDSMYQNIKKGSLLQNNDQYNVANFTNERKRISKYLRNNGVYYFNENDIRYDAIYNDTTKKVKTTMYINDRAITVEDTTASIPHKLYKIDKINIYVDNEAIRDKNSITDSVQYKNYTLYGSKKIKYRPKAITNAVFINPNEYYSDSIRLQTNKSLANLKIFNNPNINFKETSDGKKLISEINLSPVKKFNLNPNIDFIHSNIQDFGISGNLSLTFRNVFRGAEILQLNTRGNIGSSKDLANPNNVFFNLSEYGADLKLTFPRIFFLFPTAKLIKKEYLPSTNATLGFFRQTNIGLDKENFTGIIDYNWVRKKNNISKFELLNLQYVRNLRVEKYFDIYTSSYDRLNEIAQVYNTNNAFIDANGNLTANGSVGFINQVNSGAIFVPDINDKNSVRSIGERRERLIQNNLIAASSFTFSTTNKQDIYDYSFYNLKVRLESAGNILALLSNVIEQPFSDNGKRTLFGVEYSQYIKGDFEYIKHWDLGKKKSYAMRAFAGLAVPYGNSNSIPFLKSYFSGGSNDNRGWQPYSLGPGFSGAINDFNEANLKLSANAEYRFPFFGQLYGALFVDAGNIWNVFDNVTDEAYTFNGVKSLKDLAIGSGIGFRYDFNFFVFRLDFGYKTYNPARIQNERWFRDINFSQTVVNFGINYPF